MMRISLDHGFNSFGRKVIYSCSKFFIIIFVFELFSEKKKGKGKCPSLNCKFVHAPDDRIKFVTFTLAEINIDKNEAHVLIFDMQDI
jgi:hypothetical protein